MPPKKIKPEVEKIEFMNVPLKKGFRYATEDEAINANKVLLWGKYTISIKKLKENRAKIKAPNRLTRAKELRRDTLLMGVDVKERGSKSSNKEAKAMKKYDPEYDYQIEDLPALEKIYDDIDAKMDAGDDSDELADLQEAVYDNMQRLQGLKKMKGSAIMGYHTMPEHIPLHRAIGGKFEKEHGLGNVKQAYFYVYFSENPPDKGRTKYRPATPEEAINNNMVSLYGMRKIPEALDKKGQLIGHAGNIKEMNKVQLQTLFAGMKGKRNKLLKDFNVLIFKVNNTSDDELIKQYEKDMEGLDEKDYEVGKMQLKIINAINKIDGKPKIKKMDRVPLKYEKKEEKYEPEPEEPEEPEPEPIRAVKPKRRIHREEDDDNIIIINDEPKNKQKNEHYHIFENENEKIKIPFSYFNSDCLLKSTKASKLKSKNVYLHPKHYQEKDINKLFFKKNGTGLHGGKINAKHFFEKVGSTLTNVGNQIKSGVQSGINYADKVIHGTNDYLPPVRDIINKYSNNTITGVTVGRAPVPSAITMALNGVSGGTFKEGMNKQPYDKLFHLFLYLTMNDGTKILFEKNATINSAINPPLPPDTETLLITPPNNTTTLSTFLQNGQNKMGNSYYVYDPHYNNCQDYIIGLLTGNGWGTQQDYQWIKQDTGQLFANNKYLGTVAKGVTNFGGVVDRMIKGVGFKKNKHIQSILFKRPEWSESKAKIWLGEHGFKSDVDIKPEHLRYRQCEPDENKYNYKTEKIGNKVDFIIGYKK